MQFSCRLFSYDFSGKANNNVIFKEVVKKIIKFNRKWVSGFWWNIHLLSSLFLSLWMEPWILSAQLHGLVLTLSRVIIGSGLQRFTLLLVPVWNAALGDRFVEGENFLPGIEFMVVLTQEEEPVWGCWRMPGWNQELGGTRAGLGSLEMQNHCGWYCRWQLTLPFLGTWGLQLFCFCSFMWGTTASALITQHVSLFPWHS